MSAKKYVPNRLRGVMGGDDNGDSASSSGRLSSSSSSRKGRKSRPWRVDAASWKQQLQERKAVYDNFALPEKADEEQKESGHQQTTTEKELEAIPLNILTSTATEGGGNVATMLTPKRGGQVETVFTANSKTPSTPSPSSSTGNDQHINQRKGDGASRLSSTSPSSRTVSRRPSPLPRNRNKSDNSSVKSVSNKTRKGRKSPTRAGTSPHRTKRIDAFDDRKYICDNGGDDDGGEEVISYRSFNSCDRKEYYIDGAELMSSKSKDSNVAIVNENVNVRRGLEKIKIFRPKTKVRLLRHGDSDDTAESVGLPHGIEEESSSETPVNKSSMMEAVEDFIDPSKFNISSKSPKSTNSTELDSTAGGVGRQRRRISPEMIESQKETSQLSPATSTTSTTGTIMGNSSHKDTSYSNQRRSFDPSADSKDTKLNDANVSKSHGDISSDDGDDWSIRPIPSDEEFCLEKRRWPRRVDGDTATTLSGDSDIVSVTNDVVFVPSNSIMKENRETIDRELKNSSNEAEVLEKTRKHKDHESEEKLSTTPTTVTPDPLQRARKTLLLSNLNRSVRSLHKDSSSHSRDDDTAGDSSIESSFSKSIFVPLRSGRQGSALQTNHTKEIPLNILDDHGVYAAKYNKNGIYVPPTNDQIQLTSDNSERKSTKDIYNELGAYVPQSKATSSLGDVPQNDNIADEEGHPVKPSNPNKSDVVFPFETSAIDQEEESSQKSTASHSVDGSISTTISDTKQAGNTGEFSKKALANNNESGIDIDEDAGRYPDGRIVSKGKFETESSCSNENGDGKTLQDDDTSNSIENAVVNRNNVLDAPSNPGGMKQKTIQSDPSQMDTRLVEDFCENDVVDQDGDYEVDEIDLNRIRLVSELKRRVGSIYTGNHICVESIGTSEDPDPLATARRKRAAIKSAEHAMKEQVDLKAQLNDTVSALNTDHHHVIESPGKLISVKGKKWKERMAMKKIAKKSMMGAQNEIKPNMSHHLSSDDGAVHSDQEQSKIVNQGENSSTTALPEEINSAETREKGSDSLRQTVENNLEEQKTESTGVSMGTAEDGIVYLRDDYEGTTASSQDMSRNPEKPTINSVAKEPVECNFAGAENSTGSTISDDPKRSGRTSTSEKTEDVHPATQENDSEIVDGTQKVSIEQNSPRFISTSEELTDVIPNTLDDRSINFDSNPEIHRERDVVSMMPNSEAEEHLGTSTVAKESVDTTSAVDCEREEKAAEAPISTEDNHIIQGLPPNKGKKWKDRLKKKKNKKSDKNGSSKTTGTEIDGEKVSERNASAIAKHSQESSLISPSNSLGEDSTSSKSFNARPSFNRNLSDLTAEEKQRAASPTNDAQIEHPPKNIGKKSNKWKNRLAKMKGSKQDNAKSLPLDVKSEISSDNSDRGQILVDFKSPDISLPKTSEEPSDNASRDQILVDSKSSEITPPDAPEPSYDNKQPIQGAPKISEHDQQAEISISTVTSTNLDPSHFTKEETSKIQVPSQTGSNVQQSKIEQDLRQSFDVFDAFLQNGHTAPIDDESIYTEMTIGQESLLQSGLPATRRSFEEEQSYMDFTLEESIQPSGVEQNVVSNIDPKEQIMSPFMSNLLSSRMFQDVAPSIPMMSLRKEQEYATQNDLADSPDESSKRFPTITVGNDFDDDLTQITMGSLEEDRQKEDADEEKFFDAESKPFPRSPSPKSVGKKSNLSLNSRKSESAASHSSQFLCSESSKQRIVEILRKEVWSRDDNVVRSAMEELNSEAKNGRNHRAHIVRCGGVMTIMRAMEMNSKSEAIQIASCSTLEQLALDPQTQTAICEMEGISLIVRTMQGLSDSVRLQETACIALATICRQQETSTSKESMKDAEEAVPTLLSSMTRYPANAVIQAKAFQAIANLCSGGHARQRLAELSKAGGIMTLTMALQTPWDNKNDQHEAISNLAILLRGITELNEKPPLVTSGDNASNVMEQDESISNRNVNQSMSQEVDGPQPRASYIDEIPDMPIMPMMSHNGEEIPDLDQFSTMMSNLEWQIDDQIEQETGDKKSADNSLGVQQHGLDGRKHDGEEQCTIQ